MTNSRRDTIKALCDCWMLVPFAPVVPLAILLLAAWATGDYLLGLMFRVTGFE